MFHAAKLRRRVLISILVAGCGLVPLRPAEAAFSDILGALKGIALATCEGTDAPDYEARLAKTAWDNYFAKHPFGFSAGEATANGIDRTLFTTMGQTVVLQYRYFDPSTGAETSGPPIDHVEYFAEIDHAGPLALVPIGSSSTAGNHYALNYTIADCEPVIVAIPHAPGGGEVYLPGAGGGNAAHGHVLLLGPPESPGLEAWTLLPLAGLLLFAGARFARRRTA